MIRFILLQNRQGKTRLAKYYAPLEDSEKHKVEYEVHRLVVNRDPKFTNFVEDFAHTKLSTGDMLDYFFSICVDITDNELAYLECIHLFVEILDHFFSNVCELDLVFNFHKLLHRSPNDAALRAPLSAPKPREKGQTKHDLVWNSIGCNVGTERGPHQLAFPLLFSSREAVCPAEEQAVSCSTKVFESFSTAVSTCSSAPFFLASSTKLSLQGWTSVPKPACAFGHRWNSLAMAALRMRK
ncbi:hypothetical protein ACP70R_001565 [Stipagrostis hirtigluma subsp. patula]